MLRYLLRQPDTRLNRGMTIFWTGLTLLFLLMFFVMQLSDSESALEIPVRPLERRTEVSIAQFPKATIVAEGVMRIPDSKIWQRLIATTSDSLLDPIHLFWLICIITVYLVFFREIEIRKPFTRKTLLGMRVLFILSILLYFAVCFREYWLNQTVRELSGGTYRSSGGGLLFFPELLLTIALQRLVHVFRKGYQLTLEQQYTV
jgi:hypothetical protein